MQRHTVIQIALAGLLCAPGVAATPWRAVDQQAPSQAPAQPPPPQPGESTSARPPDQDESQPPDSSAPAAKKDKSSSSKKQSGANQKSQNADDAVSRRINNTAQAEHDVEVGKYYEKRDKFDAAIDRYKEAAELLPTYALPSKLMGEAYERKHFLPEAVQAYENYLKIAPNAGDAGEVRKRLAHLHAQMEEEDRRRAAATKP